MMTCSIAKDILEVSDWRARSEVDDEMASTEAMMRKKTIIHTILSPSRLSIIDAHTERFLVAAISSSSLKIPYSFLEFLSPVLIAGE